MASIFSRQMEVIVYLLGATAEYPGEIEAELGGGGVRASRRRLRVKFLWG